MTNTEKIKELKAQVGVLANQLEIVEANTTKKIKELSDLLHMFIAPKHHDKKEKEEKVEERIEAQQKICCDSSNLLLNHKGPCSKFFCIGQWVEYREDYYRVLGKYFYSPDYLRVEDVEGKQYLLLRESAKHLTASDFDALSDIFIKEARENRKLLPGATVIRKGFKRLDGSFVNEEKRIPNINPNTYYYNHTIDELFANGTIIYQRGLWATLKSEEKKKEEDKEAKEDKEEERKRREANEKFIKNLNYNYDIMLLNFLKELVKKS